MSKTQCLRPESQKPLGPASSPGRANFKFQKVESKKSSSISCATLAGQVPRSARPDTLYGSTTAGSAPQSFAANTANPVNRASKPSTWVRKITTTKARMTAKKGPRDRPCRLRICIEKAKRGHLKPGCRHRREPFDGGIFDPAKWEISTRVDILLLTD